MRKRPAEGRRRPHRRVPANLARLGIRFLASGSFFGQLNNVPLFVAALLSPAFLCLRRSLPPGIGFLTRRHRRCVIGCRLLGTRTHRPGVFLCRRRRTGVRRLGGILPGPDALFLSLFAQRGLLICLGPLVRLGPLVYLELRPHICRTFVPDIFLSPRAFLGPRTFLSPRTFLRTFFLDNLLPVRVGGPSLTCIPGIAGFRRLRLS